MKLLIPSLLALCACNASNQTPAPAVGPMTIFAASSLKELVTEIAAHWSQRSGRPHRLQFEASSMLARQIKEGAVADVFITATPEWLDELKTLERFDWLSNRLVLVAARESAHVDLKRLESLALAGEQVPAGKYARAALSYLGVPPPARTIYGANVRDVLAKVSQGGCQAGIVYATDAAVDSAVKVVYAFPPESHPKILYTVGRLTPAGDGFIPALRELTGIDAARKHGFEVLKH